MVEPITLAAVGAVALNEGVKFLYAQAGEILKRRRDRKATESAKLPDTAFEVARMPLQLDFSRANEVEPELRELRHALAEIGQGIDELDPGDAEVLGALDALRRTLEYVYGQPITFKGERRPDSYIDLLGEVTAREIRGYVAGIRAQHIRSGQATGRVRADSVEGQAVGLDVGEVG